VARIIMGLFSVSMASHVFEQIVAPAASLIKPIALCRILVCLALVLLFVRYRSIESRAELR